jgi:hypothetical protein
VIIVTSAEQTTIEESKTTGVAMREANAINRVLGKLFTPFDDDNIWQFHLVFGMLRQYR